METEPATPTRAPPGVRPPGHDSGLVTLLFSDVVASTALKQALGDRAGVALLQEHHEQVRQVLRDFAGSEVIKTAGDSFLILFAMPSEAVRCALLLQARLRQFNQGLAVPVQDRLGLHIGEVVIEEISPGRRDVHGIQVDTCSRVMGLAQGGQILMTRGVFDSARQMLKGEDIEGVGALNWVSHGRYLVKGVEEPVEICEVAEAGRSALRLPDTTEKAQRHSTPEEEPVLGWRPAVGTVVPNTKWVLEQKLGEGGFGEVWLGRHQVMKERRVFKFCFRADRVRSLKREMTLFRLIKERIGDHPNIVCLREVYFDQPPYYVEMDYIEGRDLAHWCEAQGGVNAVPLETRLEIVAQVADALQAAHEAGVIHRDVKPGNILVAADRSRRLESSALAPAGGGVGESAALSRAQLRVQVKLTDFGIGQVVSEEYLAGVTRAGFTQTLLSSSSSHAGTQLYLAPELLAGEPATTRSDIYSLGVVLYQLMAGAFNRPLTSDWTEEIGDPLLRDDLRHCLAGKPADRFVGAGQLAQRLRSLPERQAERAERERLREQAERRRKLLFGSGAVALVLISLAGALGYGLHKAEVKEEQQRMLAYAADMGLAQQALAMNDLGRAKRLLNEHRPPPGEADLRGWEWRYLWRQCQSEALGEMCQYTNSVYSVAYAPDGKTLAVAGYVAPQPFVEIWDVPGRKRIATLQTNEGHLVAFSPRGDLLATDAAQGTINIWQASTTNLVHRIIHPDWVRVLKFSPDGTRLASLNGQGEVVLWEVAHWAIIGRIPGPQGIGNEHEGAVDFSPDGKSLAIGDGEGRLRVIDLDTGSTNLSVIAHQEMVSAVAWSPRDRILASGSAFQGGPIRLWDANSGALMGALEGHTAWIARGLTFSADGKLLYSASADETIRIWDVRAKRCLAILRGSNDKVWALAVSPDGTTLASGSRDGVVASWSALPQSKEEQPRLLPVGDPYGRAAFAPDGPVIAEPHEGVVHLFELPSLRKIEPIPALGTNVNTVAYSPDGRLIVSGSTDGWLRVWSCAERRLLQELQCPNQPGLGGVRFSSDGKRLFSGLFTFEESTGGELVCWDSRTWRRLWSFAAENTSFFASVSPDGRLAISGNRSGQLRWWNTASRNLLAATPGHRLPIAAAAFSPDGKLAASVAFDGTVAVWDVSSFKPVRTFKGHMQGVHALAFSPDGRRLATGGGTSREGVKLWDLATYRELVTLTGQGFMFQYLIFSPDGNWLAARSREGQLHLWHAPSLVEIEAVEAKEKKEAGAE